MQIFRWLVEEIRSIAWVTLYFAACFVVIIMLKQLWLAEYGIAFSGLATALLAALVTAKVVIVLDQVRLIRRLQHLPGIVEVVIRSLIYTAAVLLVMILERAFEARAEHGGFLVSLANISDHPDMSKLWATTICVGLSFLAYNTFGVLARVIGSKQMVDLFLSRHATQP